MQPFTRSIERLKSTYRWLGFLAWLTVGHLGPLPIPNLPPQQWPRLPLGRIRQAAEVMHPWLLTVLKERQQRGLGWREATDAPVLAALAASGRVPPSAAAGRSAGAAAANRRRATLGGALPGAGGGAAAGVPTVCRAGGAAGAGRGCRAALFSSGAGAPAGHGGDTSGSVKPTALRVSWPQAPSGDFNRRGAAANAWTFPG